MQTLFALLVISIIALNIIFLSFAGSFLALYYVLWLGVFGTALWKNRTRLEAWLTAIPGNRAVKFIGLGLLMIAIEETLAGFSMHLATAESLGALGVGILQFYAFNFFTLPGLIIGWYLLLERYVYERKEVFLLIGIFGIYAEKTLTHLGGNPLTTLFLILPTMFTYMLILAPSVMSHRPRETKSAPRFKRYALGLIVPIACSLPFIMVLMRLRAEHPELFPPAGFVS